MKLKTFLLSLAVGAAPFQVMAEGIYTRQCNDEVKVARCEEWMESGAWRNGFEKAEPHESVNALDFYEQYSKNKEQWNAMFRWLEETDLLAIPGGKHPIEGTSLVVSVEDSKNGPLEKRQSESHRKKIDFQYVVKGTERFGIIDHETSIPNCEYKPDVIHYDYDVSKARFYDSTPDKYFLFFPEDWHIAKINNDTDNQDIRVIVVKLDYVE
ncbi:MAG: YhcH/YjgK/YiaL family protein [Muribaculaceae bacterium]|nr:YhcH/YjgK/YiaL family protein [Muribaculaceae bacterium]